MFVVALVTTRRWRLLTCCGSGGIRLVAGLFVAGLQFAQAAAGRPYVGRFVSCLDRTFLLCVGSSIFILPGHGFF